MATEQRFELRAGREVWVTLCSRSDGRKILEHSLSELAVCTCPGLGAYDGAGRPLSIGRRSDRVCLDAPDGARQLTLQMAANDTAISDATDPKGQIQLVVKLVGDGSKENEPLKESGYVFNLRWIAQP